MDKASLPPGFRFHPTDIELVYYYLKRKIMGKPFRFKAISEIELYNFAPWDLPEKSCLQSKDLEWYFFCPGGRKYANGLRKNRATDIGYWKTTGKGRSISYNSQTVAMKKTLVFHLGRAPKGVRTDWVMHEYRLEDKELADAGILQDAYVLCKIFKKSGPGPKNGEQYGAPFEEEDWENDKVNDSSVSIPPTCDGSLNLQSDHALQSETPAGGSGPCYSPEYFSVDRLLHELSERDDNRTLVVQENNGAEIPVSSILHRPVADGGAFSDGNGIYDDLEDLSTEVELKSADDVYFSKNMQEFALQHALLELSNQATPNAFYDMHSLDNTGEEHIWHHTELGTSDGSYMEFNDFQFPVESPCSELVDPGKLFGHRYSLKSLSNINVPALLRDTNTSSLGAHKCFQMACPSGTTGGRHSADFHGQSACQTTDEIVDTSSIQSSAGGEIHKLPSDSVPTSQGNSDAKLQCLFGSLPARPAIAAEYPSSLKDLRLGRGISYHRSSIHVKAEVTLQCPYTEDSRLTARNELVSSSSVKQVMPCREIARGSHSSGRGFAFVFFLGVVSAFMWIFLLALGAKVGKSAWKLFLSW